MTRILPDLTSPEYEPLKIHNPNRSRFTIRKRKKPVDATRCHFGSYKGTPWKDVPNRYLQWIVSSDITDGTAITNEIKATVILELSTRPSALKWLRKTLQKMENTK